MSVPKSRRSTSPCEYVIRAGEVDRLVGQLAIKLPKRWDGNRKDALLRTSDDILRESVSANAIWAATDVEREARLRHLTEAYCACAVLQVRLDQIANERPVRRYDEPGNDGETVHVERRCVSDSYLEIV